MSVDEVMRLVDENTAGRDLGFLGEKRVNVLELNLALDREDSAEFSMTDEKQSCSERQERGHAAS